jgi:Domain of unknown function (DUF202)
MSGSSEVSAGPWRPGSPSGRTAMAWIRTSISVFLSAGAAARLAALEGLLLVEAMAGLAAVAGLGSIALWWQRFRRGARSSGTAWQGITASTGAAVAAVSAVCCVALATTALAVGALVR